jgi:hypothetical protein
VKFISKMENSPIEQETSNRSPSIRVKDISTNAASVMTDASSDLSQFNDQLHELNKSSTEKIKEQWLRSTECLDYLADTTVVKTRKYMAKKSVQSTLTTAFFLMFIALISSCSSFLRNKIEH